MGQLFADAARAYLSAGINNTDTTISIAAGGALFPVANGTDWFKAVLQDANGIEIVYVTAHTSASTSFTVTRGQEGTTARSFAAGSVFGLRVTAADTAAFAGKVDKVTGKGLSTEDYTAAEKTKLAGIAASATANSSDAALRDRSTHTGAQAISTITDLQTTLDAKLAASNGTASGLTLNDGYTEEVFAVTGTTPALSPTNGSIQTWTLSGNSTPTAGTWAAGQSITLMVDDGSAATITWTSLAVTWKTNAAAAPTLNTTGYTVIQLWKVGTTIYGARVGDA